jgi:hypothetical protein
MKQNTDTCCSHSTPVKANNAFSWSQWLLWKKSMVNTTVCLIGCSIGDLSMMSYLMMNHKGMNPMLMMSLAMITGLLTSILLESIILYAKDKLSVINSIKTALAMSFLSMLAMELAMNLTDYFLTYDKDLTLANAYFWFAISISMFAGFITPLPYNYYKLAKFGKACH